MAGCRRHKKCNHPGTGHKGCDMKSLLLGAAIAMAAALAPAAGPSAPSAATAGAGAIIVENTRADKTVTLSAAELAKLPRAEIEAGKQHRKYSGVPLSELLRAAGVEWGGKCSPLLTCYVLVESVDGYRVLFSIPEIDPQQRHQMVILADRCDGKPLSGRDGPYQTIEEDAKERGRWVKQVKSVSLHMAIRPRAPAIEKSHHNHRAGTGPFFGQPTRLAGAA